MKKDHWEGAYRVAGKGNLGIFYGKPVWTPKAVKDRLAGIDKILTITWVERYQDGKWSKLDNIEEFL